MRILFVLLIIIGFVSFAIAQSENQENPPIKDNFSTVYSNSKNLKVILTEAATTLKTVSDSKIYIVYYKGREQSKLKFDEFKLKAQNILVKSNNIKNERVIIIDSGNYHYNDVSFLIWIIDKDENRIYFDF